MEQLIIGVPINAGDYERAMRCRTAADAERFVRRANTDAADQRRREDAQHREEMDAVRRETTRAMELMLRDPRPRARGAASGAEPWAVIMARLGRAR